MPTRRPIPGDHRRPTSGPSRIRLGDQVATFPFRAAITAPTTTDPADAYLFVAPFDYVRLAFGADPTATDLRTWFRFFPPPRQIDQAAGLRPILIDDLDDSIELDIPPLFLCRWTQARARRIYAPDAQIVGRFF